MAHQVAASLRAGDHRLLLVQILRNPPDGNRLGLRVLLNCDQAGTSAGLGLLAWVSYGTVETQKGPYLCALCDVNVQVYVPVATQKRPDLCALCDVKVQVYVPVATQKRPDLCAFCDVKVGGVQADMFASPSAGPPIAITQLSPSLCEPLGNATDGPPQQHHRTAFVWTIPPAGSDRLGQCFSSMRRTWLGLGRLGGGAIDRAQPEPSSNEFVRQRKPTGSPSPSLSSSKALLAAASRRA